MKSQNPAYADATKGQVGFSGGGHGRGTEGIGHADADGMETVPAWECEPNCPIRLLDEQTKGRLHGAGHARDAIRQAEPTGMFSMSGDGQRFGDSGGASRFFYVAKASSKERNRGLDEFAQLDRPAAMAGEKNGRACNVCGSRAKPGNYLKGDPRPWPSCGHDDWSWQPEGHRHKGGTRNTHPTVKPIALMRWLVRLVTPSSGTVLDPFTGSGTTGIACLREGFSFIGIEREPEYVALARARIIGDSPLPNGALEKAA